MNLPKNGQLCEAVARQLDLVGFTRYIVPLLAVAGLVVRISGASFSDTLLIQSALWLQIVVGNFMLRSLVRGARGSAATVSLSFGVGSMALAVAVWIAASIGGLVLRSAHFVLENSALIALPLLAASLWVGLRDIQGVSEALRNYFWLSSLAIVSLIAVDWRLIVLFPVSVIALVGVRLVDDWHHSHAKIFGLTLGLALLAGELLRICFVWLGVRPTAREFALDSRDFDYWVAMAWSVIRFGPFDDYEKVGTPTTYHMLTTTWVGATSLMSRVRAEMIAALVVYVLFVLLVVAVVHVLVARGQSQSPKLKLFVMSAAVFGSLSAIEFKAQVSPESLTQIVATGWFLVLLTLVIQYVRSDSSLPQIVALGIGFGFLYLAKATTLASAVLIMGLLLFDGRSSISRRRLSAVLAISIMTGCLLYFVYHFPARDLSVYGSLELEVDLKSWFANFFADQNFNFLEMLAASALPVLAVIAMSLSRWRLKPRADLYRAFTIAGVVQIVLSIVIRFPGGGSGESYVFSNGFMFLWLGLCHLIFFQDFENIKSDVLRYRIEMTVILIAGVGYGALSGAVLWLLRLDAANRVSWKLLALFSLVGGFLWTATVLFASRRSATDHESNSRSLGSFFVLAAVVIVAGLSQGNYVAYALRSPLVVALGEAEGNVIAELGSLFRTPRAAERIDTETAKTMECLRQFSNHSAVLAIDGVYGPTVLGMAERRLYYNPYVLDFAVRELPGDSPLRIEMERRRLIVSDVLERPSPQHVSRLAADGVDFLLVRMGGDMPEGFSSGLGIHRCSSSTVRVFKLRL